VQHKRVGQVTKPGAGCVVSERFDQGPQMDLSWGELNDPYDYPFGLGVGACPWSIVIE
jgi:hypothetical protein